MQHKISSQLSLPTNFNIKSILDFYKRDPIQIAEQVNDQHQTIRKGIILNGHKACINFSFTDNTVTVMLITDSMDPSMTIYRLTQWASHILGLRQPIEEFESTYAQHQELGPLLQKQSGLRVPLLPTQFEALTDAIISQQIHLKVATAIRRKWITMAGIPYDDKLWCYPDAQSVLKMPSQKLHTLGLTQTKIKTLLQISKATKHPILFDEQYHYLSQDLAKIAQSLLNISGIGPWTVQCTLLRGFGYLDSSLHQDAGVRSALQYLLKQSQKLSILETKQWLSQFSPWRGLVAMHLWEFLSTIKN